MEESKGKLAAKKKKDDALEYFFEKGHKKGEIRDPLGKFCPNQ